MQKKGQTTLFAILGLTILLVVVLYSASIYLLKEKPSEQVKQSAIEAQQDQPIKAFIDSCVEQTSKLSIFFFGFVGGDLDPAAYSNFFSYDVHYKIPYLYYSGKTHALTQEFVEKTLERYVDTKLKKCISGFEQFKGPQIIDVAPKTKVGLLDNEVTFLVEYPVTVMRDGKKSVIGPSFSTRVPLRLKEITLVSNKIVEQKVADPTLIHWDYLTEVTKKNYNVTAYAELQESIIYRIVDEKYELLGEPYIFQFAVKIR